MCLEVVPEEGQAHVKEGPRFHTNQHVGPVEHEEDLPDQKHLRAVVTPQVGKVLQEGGGGEGGPAAELYDLQG